MKHKTENILKDLQKHFRAEWLANIQDLTMVTLGLHRVWDAQVGSLGRGGRGLGRRGVIPGAGKGPQSSQSHGQHAGGERPSPELHLGGLKFEVTERVFKIRCSPPYSPRASLCSPAFPLFTRQRWIAGVRCGARAQPAPATPARIPSATLLFPLPPVHTQSIASSVHPAS